MDEATRILFEQLGISLLLGLLVGLQRQHSDSVLAGLRTFPIITILGTISALLDGQYQAGGWILGAGFVSVAAVVVITNLSRLQREGADFGITTEAAILLMFAVGAYVVSGNRIVAVAVGAGAAVLLQFKPELHGISARLGDEDLRAVMTFALITFIILPVLPNQTYDTFAPLNVVNPFETWLMVVLMVGISLGGYLIYKFFGRNAGILLGGILGGAISSTATTISYAKRTASRTEGSAVAALVILIASTVVFGRVLLEIFVVAPTHFVQLAPPVVVMLLSGAAASAVVWIRLRRSSDEMPAQRNPTELKSALVFAALYAGVLMALSTAKTYLGGQGIYAIAILSGLTDMDAITLSTARMVNQGEGQGGLTTSDGWKLIVVASMSNLVFKASIVAIAGNRRLLWQTALLLGIPFLTGAVLLLVWPAMG